MGLIGCRRKGRRGWIKGMVVLDIFYYGKVRRGCLRYVWGIGVIIGL